MLRLVITIGFIWLFLGGIAPAAPSLTNPSRGRLELVTPQAGQQQMLDQIDGLAFDAFGNLFGALEIDGAAGGVVAIDKATGAVTPLVTGIGGADQIAIHPSGDFFVTSEILPASRDQRVWQIAVTYDASHKPVAATKANVHSSLTIDNPEGLVVLDAAGAYGVAGDLYVAEDVFGGSIVHMTASGAATTLANNLDRPEGLAFGDFAGAAAPALYVAETATDRVRRIASNGAVSTLGSPATVSLSAPDNLEFGPDGFLYVSEDRSEPDSRVIRIDHLGQHTVFASGFGQAQGLAFDPTNGDLYIAEQDLDRVWRVDFFDPSTGDYNDDGVVDAADYVVWRDTMGQSGTGLAADGNGSGDIDAGDLELWRARFGSSVVTGVGRGAAFAVNVPEPASLAAIFGSGLVVSLRRRILRRSR